jgi:hypothetical protein
LKTAHLKFVTKVEKNMVENKEVNKMLTSARLISYSQPPEGELYVGKDVK